MNYRRFFKKYWYALIIVVSVAAFMTPGLTFISFVLFVFISGMATRPYFDNLIVKRFFYQEQQDYSEPLPFVELKQHNQRRKTSKP